MGVLAFTEVTGVSASTDTGATGVPITGMAMGMGMGIGMGMGTGMATLTTGLILLTHLPSPTTSPRSSTIRHPWFIIRRQRFAIMERRSRIRPILTTSILGTAANISRPVKCSTKSEWSNWPRFRDRHCC